MNVSPYEVPTAVRSEHLDGGWIRIEFRYADDVSIKDGQDFPIASKYVIRQARHSRRILAISVNMDMLNARTLGVTIRERPELLTEAVENALTSGASSSVPRDQVRHFIVEAVRANAPQLVEAAAC